MYRPVLNAVGGSLFLTALVALIPLLALFVMLGVLRISAWKAALASLVISVLVAVIAYSMPVGQALLAGTEGAAFGFFPILWIVINAIWVYNMTVVTGHFDVLRRSFATVSDDQRIQAVIIAFCFGALLEALAGFGTPVAITSVMLIALGFRPIKAAVVALVANTAPVAFGALAVPITTLATVSQQSEHSLAQMVGRQTPLLGIFVPMALVFIIDKGRGVRETLPATLTCGFAFGIAQYLTSNFISTQLTDIVAALVGALSVVLLLRVWQPPTGYAARAAAGDRDEQGGGRAAAPVKAARAGNGRSNTARSNTARSNTARSNTARSNTARSNAARSKTSRTAAAGAGGSDHPVGTGVETLEDMRERDSHAADTRADVLRAYAPYLIIVALFVVTQLPGLKTLLAAKAVNPSFSWPGLHLQSASGKPSTVPLFKLGWLSAAGTLMVVAGLITIPVIGIRPRQALRAYGATYRQLAAAIVTVMAVLGLAYVMNASGQTATLGTWLAASGALFALISPILGWLGVAVTGSDTSSNSLFGALQVQAANQTGLSPLLMAAANSSGGVLGKMVSPQNLAIAAAAVGLSGREGDIFRKVLGWSVLFLALMCVIVFLQSTPVLSWMVP